MFSMSSARPSTISLPGSGTRPTSLVWYQPSMKVARGQRRIVEVALHHGLGPGADDAGLARRQFMAGRIDDADLDAGTQCADAVVADIAIGLVSVAE